MQPVEKGVLSSAPMWYCRSHERSFSRSRTGWQLTVSSQRKPVGQLPLYETISVTSICDICPTFCSMLIRETAASTSASIVSPGGGGAGDGGGGDGDGGGGGGGGGSGGQTASLIWPSRASPANTCSMPTTTGNRREGRRRWIFPLSFFSL